MKEIELINYEQIKTENSTTQKSIQRAKNNYKLNYKNLSGFDLIETTVTEIRMDKGKNLSDIAINCTKTIVGYIFDIEEYYNFIDREQNKIKNPKCSKINTYEDKQENTSLYCGIIELLSEDVDMNSNGDIIRKNSISYENTDSEYTYNTIDEKGNIVHRVRKYKNNRVKTTIYTYNENNKISKAVIENSKTGQVFNKEICEYVYDTEGNIKSMSRYRLNKEEL